MKTKQQSDKLKVGDFVKLDEGNATIFVALYMPKATGIIRRKLRGGRLVIEWDEGFHTATPKNYIKGIKIHPADQIAKGGE